MNMNIDKPEWSDEPCASVEEYASQFPPSFHDENMKTTTAHTIAFLMEFSPMSTPEIVDTAFSEYSPEYKAYCFDLYRQWKAAGYPWIGKVVESLTGNQMIAHAFGAMQVALDKTRYD